MKFGENLRNLRKIKKLSQEQLAEKMHVSRQSVSKWETGDAYPEMNNILELCKIFHCGINNLVNDNILDVDSLDDEIKMNIVKFKKEQQNKMKVLSKTIAVIAKIGKILVTTCIPIIFVSMIILGIIINKIEVVDNEIRFSHIDDKISFIKNNNKITVKINNQVVDDISNQKIIEKTKEILENNSKYVLLGYVEIGFIFLIISLVLIRTMLKSLENLFENINKGDTPFKLENVSYIKKIAYLMILVTILPSIIEVIFEIIFRIDLNIGFELFSLIEILFLFSIAYIFQYGYEIQLDSKGKMYGEN